MHAAAAARGRHEPAAGYEALEASWQGLFDALCPDALAPGGLKEPRCASPGHVEFLIVG